MTRRGYAWALAAAVTLLVLSMGAVLWATSESRMAGPAEAPLIRMGPGNGWGPGGRWDNTPTVSQEQARTIAQGWADQNIPGATVNAGRLMPMGYRFVAAKGGSIVAVIMVDEDTGAVVGRAAEDLEGLD